MASPFARSVRSIESDKFNVSLVTIAIAIVVILAWTLWFFFSQITIYVDSYDFIIEDSGFIQTSIPTNQAKNIKQGQSAVLLLDGDLGEELGVVSAYVYQIERHTEVADIELYTPSHYRDLSILQDDVPTGQVRIQIETASPAALILEALGRNADTPSLVSGPLQ